MIDPEIPREGEPSVKSAVRRNWSGIIEHFQGMTGIRPLLHGYAEVLAQPAIVGGIADLDLEQARAHAITLTEDLAELRLTGALERDRLITVTIRLLQTDPAKAMPALDRFVWPKGKPQPPAPGHALWLAAITIDGGLTWEAF